MDLDLQKKIEERNMINCFRRIELECLLHRTFLFATYQIIYMHHLPAQQTALMRAYFTLHGTPFPLSTLAKSAPSHLSSAQTQ